MNRHSRFILLSLAAMLCVLLHSCLDLDMHVHIKKNDTVTITLTYTLDNALARLGAFDDRQLKSIPILEDDFQQIAAANPAIDLVRYRDKRGDDTRVISARLRFESIASFNAYFVAEGADSAQTVRISPTAQMLIVPLTLHTSLQQSDQPEIDKQLRQQFIEAFLAQYTVTVAIKAPSQIKTANYGEIDGRTARYALPLSNLLHADDDVIWNVRW